MSHTSALRPRTALVFRKTVRSVFSATALKYGTTDKPPCAHRLEIRSSPAGRYKKHRNCANIPKHDGHDPGDNTLHRGKIQSQTSEKPFFQNNAPARTFKLAGAHATSAGVRGVRREVLRGFTKSSWGSGGGVSPPAGSGAEPWKILKLTLFRG